MVNEKKLLLIDKAVIFDGGTVLKISEKYITFRQNETSLEPGGAFNLLTKSYFLSNDSLETGKFLRLIS